MGKRFIAAVNAAILLTFFIAPPASADSYSALAMSGPGGRIHGADISRWQHPNDKAINFSKMYSAGIRFVMIKASDTRDDADQLAIKYLAKDRSGAQKVGIYTGFYHYASLPDVTTTAAAESDARVQAQKVIWRLTSLGGYSAMDLPYALDLENNCVRLRANKSCAKYAPRSIVTAWAKTFMAAIKDHTGRTPIFYSYPQFLESAMVRDAALRQYPLWMAQYALNPFTPTSAPGVKKVGCYVHSWTSSSCRSQWIVWQYTSCGNAAKYGVPGRRLDLNVFKGDEQAFRAFATGTWIPVEEDFMPHNETSTMVIDSLASTIEGKDVTASLQVLRPDSSPVVTGDVKFILLNNVNKVKFTAAIYRTTSGAWRAAITGLPAGTYSAQLQFKDLSQTHAPVATDISFDVAVNPNPIASPSPTPKPSPTSRGGDTCRNQVKN
jgi:lysozyme